MPPLDGNPHDFAPQVQETKPVLDEAGEVLLRGAEIMRERGHGRCSQDFSNGMVCALLALDKVGTTAAVFWAAVDRLVATVGVPLWKIPPWSDGTQTPEVIAALEAAALTRALYSRKGE